MAPKKSIPVSSFLKCQYFELMKQTNNTLECSICLTDVLNCKNCMCLLSCGHAFHFECITQTSTSNCPMCRG